jgi:hypothetical protein
MEESEKLVRGEAAAKNEKNTIYHCDVDIAGDLIAGTLLSQIVYYYGLPERGQTQKLRIFKDGYYWMAKGREDWKDEIRVTPKQFDRASSILERKGLIHIEKFKFNGSPTLHLRLDFETYNRELTKWKETYVGENGALPNRKMDLPQTVNSILPKGENPTSPNGNNDLPQTVNSILPKGENPTSPNGNNDLPQTVKSLTVTTTGTTAVTTKEKESVKKKSESADIFSGHTFSEPMQAALTDWLTYKSERREGYKPTGLKSFMTQAAHMAEKYEEADIISTIQESMANNWKGICWDKLAGKEKPPEPVERPIPPDILLENQRREEAMKAFRANPSQENAWKLVP